MREAGNARDLARAQILPRWREATQYVQAARERGHEHRVLGMRDAPLGRDAPGLGHTAPRLDSMCFQFHTQLTVQITYSFYELLGEIGKQCRVTHTGFPVARALQSARRVATASTDPRPPAHCLPVVRFPRNIKKESAEMSPLKVAARVLRSLGVGFCSFPVWCLDQGKWPRRPTVAVRRQFRQQACQTV